MREHDRLFIGGDWTAPAGSGTRIARDEIFGPVPGRLRLGRYRDSTPGNTETNIFVGPDH